MFGIRIDLVCVWGLKRLGFSVLVEINLIFVSRHQNRLGFRVGTEIDLNFVWGIEFH